MSTDAQRKLLTRLVRFHFAYLVAVPLLGIVSWWFIRRGALPAMLATGFAPVAAYYAMLSHGYYLTTHLPSAIWVVFTSPLLLVVSSLLGGGFWYFYLDAAFVEVGGMCAGLVIGSTPLFKEKEYFSPVVLYIFMGGFLIAWGYALFLAHRPFPWHDNIWLVAALVNESYIYARMFLKRETTLEYGHGRAAREAGADLIPGPFKQDEGTPLIMAFAALIVLSPFILGLLNYVFK